MAAGDNNAKVRIGPISLFTLLVALCLAVLAVLALTTANASYTMSNRQATSKVSEYACESAAQTFLAEADAALASSNATDASKRAAAVQDNLASIIDASAAAASQNVTVQADVSGPNIHAQFTCDDGRTLHITLEVQDDGSYVITNWMVSAVNYSATEENLWTGM